MDAQSPAEKNKAVVAQFFDANDRSFDDLVEMIKATVDPDFVVAQAPGLPYGGDYRGVEGYLEVQEKIRSELLDLSVEDLEIVAEGDTVLTMFRMLGTSSSTGNKYDMRQVEVWRFRDGKLVSLTPFYYDTHEIRKIVGLA